MATTTWVSGCEGAPVCIRDLGIAEGRDGMGLRAAAASALARAAGRELSLDLPDDEDRCAIVSIPPDEVLTVRVRYHFTNKGEPPSYR